jgi:hypothetical protein
MNCAIRASGLHATNFRLAKNGPFQYKGVKSVKYKNLIYRESDAGILLGLHLPGVSFFRDAGHAGRHLDFPCGKERENQVYAL